MKLLKNLWLATKAATMLKDDEIGLFIPNRQVSWIVSLVLLFGCLTFITGYFWGQRKAIERFVSKIEDESFADRISYSLYTMNDRDISEFESPDTDTSAQENNESEEGIAQEGAALQSEIRLTADQEPFVPVPQVLSVPKENQKMAEVVSDKKIFVAPLAGFGTLHAADIFAHNVRKHDSNAQVKTCQSKTAKGKQITWYQVVTGEFDDREEIEHIIKKICEQEHIKDVKIVEKRKVVHE